ncbi:GDP-mannose-dependent alpha-(1-6)-phosphatidylinositol monomannoside mannosyltransferase [compost metagenome]
MKKNIAIVANSNNLYSETFIQAHKSINANVFFYYSGLIPEKLENYGSLYTNSFKNIILKSYYRIFKNQGVSGYFFKKSLKKYKIDTVLAEFGTNAANIMDVCKKINMPLVAYFFGFDAYKTDVLTEYNIKYKDLFDYCKAIMVVSLDMKEQLISLGCDVNKIVYSPCAPNDAFFQVKPTFKEPRSFIALGRFVNKKSPDSTILAFRQVVKKYPDAKLYFGGNGILEEVAKRLVNYFNLNANVEFIGVQSQAEYIGYYSKVAGFIQHSITAEDGDKEGTPVAVLEASLAGLPIISTMHAGIPEVVINGETGFLVKENDIDAMANAIIYLIENPERAKLMGAKGRDFVNQNFSMRSHLEILENTLSCNG